MQAAASGDGWGQRDLCPSPAPTSRGRTRSQDTDLLLGSLAASCLWEQTGGLWPQPMLKKKTFKKDELH